MTGESPDVAEIAASIEGRCCRAVSQAMGANVPGQAGGLARPAHDPADRFSGESDIRIERGGRRGDGRAGRVRCRGPRSTRPGRRRSDREGSCTLSRSGLSPESRPRRGGPTPQAGFPPVRPRRPLDRGCIARRVRNPRSNKHAELLYLSGPGNRRQLQSRRPRATGRRASPGLSCRARFDPGSLDVETPIRPADLT